MTSFIKKNLYKYKKGNDFLQKYLLIFLLTLSILNKNSWGQQPEHTLQKHNGTTHEHIDHSHLQHRNNPGNIVDKEVQAIAQLARVLHHAIEGEHGHSIKEFLKAFKNKEQWIHMFNFQNIALRTTRAFNLESNKAHLKNHVKNLALLFPMSHFIEVMTAPTFMAVGTVHEFSAIVIGVGSSLLSLIAIPGLDPLCILLLITYPLKPVHKSIDFIRDTVERGLYGIVTTIKLDALLSKTYSHEDRFNFIKQALKANSEFNRLFNIRLHTSKKGTRLSLFDKTNNNRVLSLKRVWDSEENRFYLQSVWFSRSTSSETLKDFFHLLPWNARSAVREILSLQDDHQKIESYKREFFIDKVNISNENKIEIFFKKEAIYLSDKMQFRNILKSNKKSPCQKSFL